MTLEEMDKKIEFILEMQAQFEANQARSEANTNNLRVSVGDLRVSVGTSLGSLRSQSSSATTASHALTKRWWNWPKRRKPPMSV